MKKIITLLLLAIGTQTFAQSFSDGVYNTNFGTINLTFEQGYEYPNGGIVYGDYKGNGTITGTTTNVGKEISGSFHNGAAEGKFIFFSPSGKQHFFDSGITSFNGNWGYGTDNKYSTNPDHIWKATSKTAGKDAIKNATNVWSGKWNTTDGAMYLMQIGNKITGTYKGVGTIEAIYNPTTRLLKGTFRNNNFNKTGYIEFYFEGNTFKGKWGWTAAMTEGNWDGTKHVKNNKELSKTTNTTQNTNSSTSNSSTSKYAITLKEMSTASKIAYVPGNEMYGFAGLRVFRVTNSGREEIKSFGNKNANFFDRTENNSFPNSKSNYIFPNTPEYLREFVINNADLNNTNVDIEVEIWHHLKLKTFGKNDDYKYVKQVLTLERMIELKDVSIGQSCSNGVVKDLKNSDIKLNVKKVN